MLELRCFSDASDEELLALTTTFLEQQHLEIGRGKIEALFQTEGLRIQRRRINDVMTQLIQRRRPRRRIQRRSYLEAVGAHFLWAMDQNEKIGFGGVKVLQALDAKWRCPIHFEVVTSLRALDHSLFFLNAVRTWQRVPYNISIDGAPAWCGVKHMMHLWWADAMDPVRVPHDDRDLLVERVSVSSSVHNPAIERSWRDVNKVTRKYREEWKDLEGQLLLRGGHRADPLDLFCLDCTYYPRSNGTWTSTSRPWRGGARGSRRRTLTTLKARGGRASGSSSTSTTRAASTTTRSTAWRPTSGHSTTRLTRSPRRRGRSTRSRPMPTARCEPSWSRGSTRSRSAKSTSPCGRRREPS